MIPLMIPLCARLPSNIFHFNLTHIYLAHVTLKSIVQNGANAIRTINYADFRCSICKPFAIQLLFTFLLPIRYHCKLNETRSPFKKYLYRKNSALFFVFERRREKNEKPRREIYDFCSQLNAIAYYAIIKK